jgi:hypothetical protein
MMRANETPIPKPVQNPIPPLWVACSQPDSFRVAGVDQLLCFMQMGNLAHTRIMDSITFFGQHVIPHFT